MIYPVLASLLVLGCMASQSASGEFNCVATTGYPKEVCHISACTTAINDHIQHELNAAFTYMLMGVQFGQYTIDRPGISKFLLEAATEERSHAIQMLDYLNTRGIKSSMMTSPAYNFKTIEKVTVKIYEVVKNCENDYHAADVFTNPILEEQHDGIRKLQGAIRAFNDLTRGYTNNESAYAMAEYIFDRKMLKGEIIQGMH
ncbi:hypothetical protein OTU49_005393 [Cherax quadricarinatus]|uniref:Ferritin n=1 Tax=Cherax quadricarinatus TaxID=27406 RepID=A0AAW0WT53_CHEQU|nr:ferritin subunit-like isoform X2 [Cherax quadricarinatus]